MKNNYITEDRVDVATSTVELTIIRYNANIFEIINEKKVHSIKSARFDLTIGAGGSD